MPPPKSPLAYKRHIEAPIIVITAFVIRSVIGAIFLGSVDLMHSLMDCMTVFHGKQLLYLPYIPVISAFQFLGGVLAARTPLSLSLCFKIVPIIHDSLIALLIYDIIRRRNARLAFAAGILYACSPVAVIINSLHGQWDSIVLFYLIFCFSLRELYAPSMRRYILQGVFFGLSCMIKPYPVIFLPMLFEPLVYAYEMGFRRYARNQALVITGAASIVVLGLFAFAAYGYNLQYMLFTIWNYANSGVQIIGLPFAHPFSGWMFFKTRMWALGFVVFVSVLYHRGGMGSWNALLCVFSFFIGVAGYGPQQLIWLAPFLLICERYTISALYQGIGSAFLLAHYCNPHASALPWENMGVFASLKGFDWLMPPDFMMSPRILPFLNAVGNYVIPALGLSIAGIVLWMQRKRRKGLPCKGRAERPWETGERPPLGYFNSRLLCVIIFWCMLAITNICVMRFSMLTADAVLNALGKKLSSYSLIVNMVLPSDVVIGSYKACTSAHAGNIIVVIMLMALMGIVLGNTAALKKYENKTSA